MASLVRGWEMVQGRASNDASFDRLFLAEYSRVVAIAQRILGDRHEAEDVAQEVFSDFHAKHSPDAEYAGVWLYRAASHTALNVIRTAQRRQRRESADALDRGAHTETDDPQRAAEVAELRREMRAALSRLPEKSAAVLALRYSGLSYAEVAAALGVNIGQVGTLLRRAEESLRKEMTHETPR